MARTLRDATEALNKEVDSQRKLIDQLELAITTAVYHKGDGINWLKQWWKQHVELNPERSRKEELKC